jgi:4-amino-4-deoxy-L-arabinose transferase-like glycosyltransferase
VHEPRPIDPQEKADQRWDATFAPAAVAIILAVTVARIVLLGANPLNLYFDEAQYWTWAQDPAFGYFSKPPLIAWIIAATTGLFGDSEFAIRIASPLLHAITSWLVFILARDLYDERAAFWSSVIYLTIPAVTVSSGIISTDVPLLAAWTAALIALDRCVKHESYSWAAAAGVAIGLGLLAKYAMGYFAVGVLVYAAVSPDGRRFLLSGRSLVAAAIAAVVLLPNILWNFGHSFATVSHTASNANWGGSLFNFDEFTDFIVGQFGVIGPLLMLMLIFGLATLRTRLREAGLRAPADVFLLAFSLPILIIVAGQAFISRANANWAAPAYVGLTVLVAVWALRLLRPRILAASLLLHLALAGLVYAAVLNPTVLATLDSLGSKAPVSNGFKRMKGWDEIGLIVTALAESRPYTAILSDDREDIAELFYYARPRTPPLLMWDEDGVPEDHFELTYPFKGIEDGPVLFITRRQDYARITDKFATTELLAAPSIAIGGGRTRDFRIFELLALRPSFDSP